MEHGFSILMFIFAGALLLYGLLMIVTGDRRLFPYRIEKVMKHDMKDEKRYVRYVGKIVSATALAAIIGSVTGWLASPLVTGIVTVLAFVLCIYIGVKLKPEGIDE